MRIGLFFCRFALFFQEMFQRRRHRREFGLRRLYVEPQPRVVYGFGGRRTEAPDFDVALLEVREIFEQRLYSCRTEKDEHIVVERFVGFEIVAYRAVHHGFGIVDVMLVEQRIFSVVYVGNGEQVFFVGVFGQSGNKVVELARVAEEDFTFAVSDVFLEVEGDGFGCAEIFHRFRNRYAQAFAQSEKVVDSRSRGEDDRRVFGQ